MADEDPDAHVTPVADGFVHGIAQVDADEAVGGALVSAPDGLGERGVLFVVAERLGARVLHEFLRETRSR